MKERESCTRYIEQNRMKKDETEGVRWRERQGETGREREICRNRSKTERQSNSEAELQTETERKQDRGPAEKWRRSKREGTRESAAGVRTLHPFSHHSPSAQPVSTPHFVVV